MRKNEKTNPNITNLIFELKKASRENDAAIWRDIAKRLEKPSSRWSEVNLSEIERYAKDKDTIAIPGKLLGAGSITKAVNVAAFSASNSAKTKLEEAGGTFMQLEELAATNPKGSGVRIMG